MIKPSPPPQTGICWGNKMGEQYCFDPGFVIRNNLIFRNIFLHFFLKKNRDWVKWLEEGQAMTQTDKDVILMFCYWCCLRNLHMLAKHLIF